VTPYFVSFGKKKKLFLLLGVCGSAFCCEKSVCCVRRSNESSKVCELEDELLTFFVILFY
jgi:hypothetical protein